MLIRVRILIATGLILLLSGCATAYKVNTDYDSSKDFLTLHSWNWLSISDAKAGGYGKSNQRGTPFSRDLTEQRITHAVENTMALRGYKKSQKPDFYLTYRVLVDKKKSAVTQVQPYGGYYRYRYRGSYAWQPMHATTYTQYYKINTLVMIIVDPITKNVIWQGQVSVRENAGDMTPQQRNQQIEQAVNLILNKFPPA